MRGRLEQGQPGDPTRIVVSQLRVSHVAPGDVQGRLHENRM